jgi:hypothetical protein
VRIFMFLGRFGSPFWTSQNNKRDEKRSVFLSRVPEGPQEAIWDQFLVAFGVPWGSLGGLLGPLGGLLGTPWALLGELLGILVGILGVLGVSLGLRLRCCWFFKLPGWFSSPLGTILGAFLECDGVVLVLR